MQEETGSAGGSPPSPAPAAAPAQAAPPTGAAERRARLRLSIGAPRASAALSTAAFAFAVIVAIVLNTTKLAQNGYANIFYSAGVKSETLSFHNFLFASFDPGGLVTVDKPPLALWVQVVSAKLFGVSPLSLLLPEAIAGVLAVAALFLIVHRRLGTLAALGAALTMAVFPSMVAVSRDNGVDPVLILLMVLACGTALHACETARWRSLFWTAVLIGLAFNTKTLAAYLAVPGIAAAYLVCAPGSIKHRIVRLALAGLVMLVVSFAWIALVELTPASQRPYVGSSTNNTELGLTFEYNGVGRVEGQVGGPGRVPVKAGAIAPLPGSSRPRPKPVHHAATKAAPSAFTSSSDNRLLADGRYENPFAFGGSPGPVRLFGQGIGDQDAWLLPFALIGILALCGVILLDALGDRDQPSALPRRALRRDPRIAFLLVFGGWLLVEFVVLSTSKGIVHPYYVSALAPGVGAMAGAGLASLISLCRARLRWRIAGIALAALAIAATIASQGVQMHRMDYDESHLKYLALAGAVAVVALALSRRMVIPALVLIFAVLLYTPWTYSKSTWLAPVEGTFPAAGPRQAPGAGGYGVDAGDLAVNVALMHYASAHQPGSRWGILTDAAQTAAPMILLGYDAGSMGGYSGTDPALDGAGLARLVASGQARYVVLGGAFSTRGGNAATHAVIAACRELEPKLWLGDKRHTYGLSLWDCAGRESALTAAR